MFGIEQLILHGIGDYLTQTNKMANEKAKSLTWAYIHSLVYSLPFFLLTQSVYAFLTIQISHMLIDHYRLARYVVFAKNWITEPHLKWADCNQTGYPNSMPGYLSTWLLIIADNVIHLSLNYMALRWL